MIFLHAKIKMDKKEISEGIIELIRKKGIKNHKSLEKLKRRFAKEHNLSKMPTNIEILTYLKQNEEDYDKIRKLLLTKPSRSISGVTPVAIMTYPFPCPHGKCAYCPGGPDSYFGETPQSYTGKEPAARRAARAKYDPYLQVFNRLEQYFALGHTPEKVELIIMGGTFPSFNKEYQDFFIRKSFQAMNDFSSMFYSNNRFDREKFNEFFELPAKFSKERTRRIQEKLRTISALKATSLEEEQEKNETSNIRIVAMCIETRPDYAREEHISQMLRLGTTRVELGVQSLYDEVLKKVNRGHGVKEVIEATQLLRDSFLKVGYHMMPGMPGSTKEMDINMFKKLFEDENFKPDALKIYPLMVFKGTKVYDWWKEGKYKPLTTEEATEEIIEMKKYVPKYCRIMRVQRDIPTKYSEAGVDITNLRQHIHKIMDKRGLKCNCIRCREPRGRKVDFSSVKMNRIDYKASGGDEIFLSYDDTKNDILLGFLRLRIPNKPFRKEITEESAGVRELHVYGEAIPIGDKTEDNSMQHRGFGRKLLKEAERIAREEFGKREMLIISGIGVKEYYKKFGYKKKGVYMSKRI